jgi:RNA polymerase sigma-70 factor (ECF subfamily)
MEQAQLEQWAEAAAGGDQAALERLYEALAPRLYGFLVGLTGRPALAEDLLQQTFLRAMESLGRRRPGNVRAWLFSIARNLTIDAARASKRLAVAPIPDDPDPAPNPSRQAEIDEMTEQIRREVTRLPDNQREVILLRYYAEMSFKEIANLLGCPLNTALTRAHYAIKKLKKVMLCEAEH